MLLPSDFRCWRRSSLVLLSCISAAVTCGKELPSRLLDAAGQLWQEPTLRISVCVLPALVALDRSVDGLFTPSGAGDAVFGAARLYGERWTPVAVAAGLYLGGWIAGSESLRRGAITVAGATAVAVAVVGVLKVGLGRGRPSVTQESLLLRPPAWDDAYQSFPSGHAAVAFAVSTALAHSIELPATARGVLYGVAALTALSRVYHHRHWFSDVVAGALIGYTAGYTVAAGWSPALRKGEQSLRWEFVPQCGQGAVGIGVSVQLPSWRMPPTGSIWSCAAGMPN